jgi:SAM-dependent methyltransferase
VLDVGAGTGKLTRLLAQRYGRVIAVEPLDGMRAILERVVPAAESRSGSAEAIPLPDASVDGVFAGQAFHWFANDRAVAEMARVLRSGGVLALVWNEPDDERPSPLPEQYETYLKQLHDAGLSIFNDAPPWQDVIARGPFGEVHEAAVPHDHVLDRAGVLDNARSVSWIASLPDTERAATLEQLDERLTDGPFAIPNRANIMWAVRT